MRGKYTTKEEVVRQMEIDHPCRYTTRHHPTQGTILTPLHLSRLTSTAVKISFPGMKSEVLVSFLGYKEPNLMFVNRCKGLCNSTSSAASGSRRRGLVACVPTKRKWKKVNMQIKTQYLGRDVRWGETRFLILILLIQPLTGRRCESSYLRSTRRARAAA